MRPKERTAVAFLAASLTWAGCGGPVPQARSGTAPAASPPPAESPEPAADSAAIRTNQLGYLPQGRKVAVLCTLRPEPGARSFVVLGEAGDTVLGPLPAERAGAFGPCRDGFRLDFSALRAPGRYRVAAGDLLSRPVRIAPDAYRGASDTLLAYLRQQRSGFNPLFRDSVHHRTDGVLVDHPTRSGEFIPVAGGWADAADYLQYVTTSAHATYMLLMAWRDHPQAFRDASGLPGANGVADVLDEARWGLEWLLGMFPEDGLLLNQIGDDRDHAFPDLPVNDSSDYGWGRGGMRPVYPCTGQPQGLLRFRNRSDGLASTAGKLASAFALGSALLPRSDAALAEKLRERAAAAYRLGRERPGVCQTAPAGAPYFYEEANWADDMELAAAQLHELTGEEGYLREAVEYARQEPMTPWMGQDTARHYEWFPWHNNGHHQLWRTGGDAERRMGAEFYRRGLEAVAARSDNAFRVGIPFIWCSNNLMVSYATQARLYRHMTGDTAFLAHEQAALDWIFGANPWGVSMVVGLPTDGVTPLDPHSIVARQLGVAAQKGGLVDGPVYRTIFESLLGIRLLEPDEYAAWNGGSVVYHDDFGDYSTNEPIMDGTANLVWLLSALGVSEPGGGGTGLHP